MRQMWGQERFKWASMRVLHFLDPNWQGDCASRALFYPVKRMSPTHGKMLNLRVELARPTQNWGLSVD